MSDEEQTWQERREVIDEIYDYFQEYLRLLGVARSAARAENRSGLIKAIRDLEDYPDPPGIGLDIDVELEDPEGSGWVN
jgi:hypothetical protein